MSIVMVTNLKEGNKVKCEQYWPSTVSHDESYGPFTVTHMNERIYPDSVIRNLSVTVSDYYLFIYFFYRYRMDPMIFTH